MRKTLSFIIGAVYGGVFGAAVVLLLTPLSGQDLRRQARQRYQSLLDEGQRAAAARRSELEGQLAALKQPRS